MIPHPLRCETCKDETCYHHPVHWKDEIKEYGQSAHYAHEFTKEYGCASHSSQQSDQEKVLDEFLTKVLERSAVEVDEDTKQILPYQKVQLDEILEIYKELRSTKQEDQG